MKKAALLMILGASACGVTPADMPKPSSSPAAAITTIPAVVAILTGPIGPDQFACTGTMVAPRVVLTSVACATGPTSFQVAAPAGVLSVLQFVTSTSPDLALLVLPSDGIQAADAVPIGTAANIGDIVTLVGFDVADPLADAWVTMEGTNEIFGWNDSIGSIVVLTPSTKVCPANRAGACLGTAASGGPMLKGTSPSWKLVGVLDGSGAYTSQGASNTTASVYVNLTQPAARSFISKANQELGLNIPGF